MQTAWKEYQHEHKQRFLDEMLELLRIPSVSACVCFNNDSFFWFKSTKIRGSKAVVKAVTSQLTEGASYATTRHNRKKTADGRQPE